MQKHLPASRHLAANVAPTPTATTRSGTVGRRPGAASGATTRTAVLVWTIGSATFTHQAANLHTRLPQQNLVLQIRQLHTQLALFITNTSCHGTTVELSTVLIIVAGATITHAAYTHHAPQVGSGMNVRHLEQRQPPLPVFSHTQSWSPPLGQAMLFSLRLLRSVDTEGFEPSISRLSAECSNQLSYVPVGRCWNRTSHIRDLQSPCTPCSVPPGVIARS